MHVFYLKKQALYLGLSYLGSEIPHQIQTFGVAGQHSQTERASPAKWCKPT